MRLRVAAPVEGLDERALVRYDAGATAMEEPDPSVSTRPSGPRGVRPATATGTPGGGERGAGGRPRVVLLSKTAAETLTWGTACEPAAAGADDDNEGFSCFSSPAGRLHSVNIEGGTPSARGDVPFRAGVSPVVDAFGCEANGGHGGEPYR